MLRGKSTLSASIRVELCHDEPGSSFSKAFELYAKD
jgi:hypothetical protein